MFLASLIKTELDSYVIWYGKRAEMRIRIELQSAVYSKTLVRKDYLGMVNESEHGGSKEDKKDKKADIGKIVNLMSNDAEKVAVTIGILNMIYVSLFPLLSCNSDVILEWSC